MTDHYNEINRLLKRYDVFTQSELHNNQRKRTEIAQFNEWKKFVRSNLNIRDNKIIEDAFKNTKLKYKNIHTQRLFFFSLLEIYKILHKNDIVLIFTEEWLIKTVAKETYKHYYKPKINKIRNQN
jgi:hypothetical protein